jgi:hypothetical protein
MEKENHNKQPAKLDRRDVLKGLATLPVLEFWDLGYGRRKNIYES